jgi:hypothetical protein
MKQLALFHMGRQVYRLRNGRYATKEMSYADRQESENKRLKFEVEKYKRMYLALVKENIKLKEQLNDKVNY